MLAHHIQLLQEENPQWSVLGTDIKNAFNSVLRQQMLNEVYESFPEIFAYASQMYGNNSSLVYDRGLDTIIVPSQEGVHQGDPLGQTLFAMTIHPVIKSVQEKHRDLTVLAYPDDNFAVGCVEQAMLLLSDLKSFL